MASIDTIVILNTPDGGTRHWRSHSASVFTFGADLVYIVFFTYRIYLSTTKQRSAGYGGVDAPLDDHNHHLLF